MQKTRDMERLLQASEFRIAELEGQLAQGKDTTFAGLAKIGHNGDERDKLMENMKQFKEEITRMEKSDAEGIPKIDNFDNLIVSMNLDIIPRKNTRDKGYIQRKQRRCLGRRPQGDDAPLGLFSLYISSISLV